MIVKISKQLVILAGFTLLSVGLLTSLITQDKFVASSEDSMMSNVEDVEEEIKAQEFYEAGFEKGKRRQYKEAIAYFDKAIELNPNFALAYLARAHAQRDKQKSLKDFRSAEEIFRRNGESQHAESVRKTRDYYERAIKVQNSSRID